MKQINRLFHSVAVTHARGAFLAGVAVLAVVVLSSSALHSRAQAVPGSQSADALVLQAEVLELLSAYHGALAYGGNGDAMASLWADNSSLTLNNGTPYVGKDAVVAFFVNSPYFHHNWVSLAPEWKTTVTVQGNIAQATTECIATDVSVTPNVVRGVIQVNATCQRIGGQWFFIQMNNFTQPQI
jgi:hypothetical protein